MAWRWEKRGRVFTPAGQRPWLASHAQLPVAHALGDETLRVFFAGRDERQRSHVTSVDLDLRTGAVGEPPAAPALAPGGLGCFDDHGVYPASVVALDDGRLALYYIGWNPGPRAPLFYATIGLAHSEDGGLSFQRASRVPVMGRGEHDPCLVTSPCVRREGDGYRMWYVSGFRWEERGDTLQSFYDIKHATSRDGRDWHRDGNSCIPLRDGESNIARPCVVRDGDRYLMLFSSNDGRGYRIGAAESDDGLTWERDDDGAGIELSDDGWDADAMAYPWVHRRTDGSWILLYNGGGFGREGFGLAAGERVA